MTAATAEAPASTTAKEKSEKSKLTSAQRQMKKHANPERPMRLFRVSKTTPDGEVSVEIKALDGAEAWAKLCDAMESWPSRHAVDAKVVLID